MIAKEDVDTQSLLAGGYRKSTSAASSHYGIPAQDEQEITRRHEELEKAGMPAEELNSLIRELDAKMRQASEQLQFELAARLRDEIMDLKKELRAMIRAQK